MLVSTPAILLAAVGLTHALHAPFGALSAGQKRRAALARLLVAWRPLWLLDEPLTAWLVAGLVLVSSGAFLAARPIKH